MPRPMPEVERGLDGRVQELGYELVDVEWAGGSARPIIRVRIDRDDAEVQGVNVSDCAKVSRALESWLDTVDKVAGRYVLEVSSPGLERPLSRPRDFERFAGRKIVVNGSATLAGRSSRLEGELLGLVYSGAGAEQGEERVRLRLPGGDVVEIPRSEITGAHLVFEW
ncbi:MAG: ribosome maturation factor RimP [Gemmatimonadetes bacterium]|nr:ribosome maturation factor RimP [Gemmatimonadota bacterium]